MRVRVRVRVRRALGPTRRRPAVVDEARLVRVWVRVRVRVRVRARVRVRVSSR